MKFCRALRVKKGNGSPVRFILNHDIYRQRFVNILISQLQFTTSEIFIVYAKNIKQAISIKISYKFNQLAVLSEKPPHFSNAQIHD